ncbi:MAG: OmpA family protein [Granulosicoccus sp.]
MSALSISYRPRRARVLGSIVGLLFICLTPLQAQDFNQRFYLNGGVGVTQLEPESSSDALTVSDKSDSGGHLAVGFDVSRFLTVEGYVASLGSAQAEFLGTSAGSVDYTVFGVSALGYLLNSRSGFILGDDSQTGLFRREGGSLYARVGIGHMRNDSTRVEHRRDYPSHAAFGIGFEYGFTNGFALRTELMSMDTDAQYLNVGILKRFGSAGALPVAAAALPVAPVVDSPEPPAEPIVFKPVQAPYIYFDTDESTLTPESNEKLDAFAERVRDTKLRLKVGGHTDWIAPEAYNMSLSVRRAEAVANYLVSKGVPRERLTTMGYGENQPISNNNTEEGRALNRRSEIQLLQPDDS